MKAPHTFNVGDEARYLVGGDWTRAKVLRVFASDSLSKAPVATVEFWHMGRKETIDVWASDLLPVKGTSHGKA